MGIGTGLIVGFSLGSAEGIRVGILAGLFFAFVYGLLAPALDFSAPFLLFTEIVLRLRTRRVARFRPLLEDALERQVLRQAGPFYQLRHEHLQDRLAARYRHEHLEQARGWGNDVPSAAALVARPFTSVAQSQEVACEVAFPIIVVLFPA